MASNHIRLEGGTRLANELRGLVDQLQAVVDGFNEKAQTLSQYNSDYVAMAADLNMTEADVTALASLVGSTSTELNADQFVAQILARCG